MPRSNYFQFKQFRIIQERSAMKIGMDGTLLWKCVDTSKAEQILNFETGSIALMKDGSGK